jgi:hypothetical protein
MNPVALLRLGLARTLGTIYARQLMREAGKNYMAFIVSMHVQHIM